MDKLAEQRALTFYTSQLPLTLVPPEVRENPPLYYWPDVNDYAMSGGMAETRGGRIWLAWFAGGDNDDAVIMLASSDDGGQSFSDPRFILDPGYAECGVHLSAVVGNLWSAPDGRLYLFFTVSLGYYDGRAGSWYTVCSNPDDDHPVWETPVRIGDGASLNKPTVLHDGTWLLPVSLWCRRYIRLGLASEGLFHELDGDRAAHVYASSDQGRSWSKISSVINIQQCFDEHMLVEREDGSLLMYLRSLNGITWCESFDGGHSWSVPVPFPGFTASARFFLSRLQSGHFILVRNACPVDASLRSHLTAFLSDDGCRTWKGGLILDDRWAVTYPDGYQDEDGNILIQYDRERIGGEILLASFREEDILAGKLVTPGGFLRRPVIQSRTARSQQHAH